MKRRGISEAVTAVLLIAVLAIGSFVAVSAASKRTTTQELSVSDALEQKGARTQELLTVITKDTSGGAISLEIINYGQKNISVKNVFVDGNPPSNYSISNSDGVIFSNNTFIPKEIMTLQIIGSGQSVQLVTNSNNLISLPLD